MQIRFFRCKYVVSALLTALFVGHSLSASAQDPFPEGIKHMWRVELKDKAGTPYSLNHPEQFLSERSLARRERQGLKVDSTDLPVSPRYVEQVKATGVGIVGTSKWNNTVLVSSKSDDVATALEALPFVKAVTCVLNAPDSVNPPVRKLVDKTLKPAQNEMAKFHSKADTLKEKEHGYAEAQMKIVNGQALHNEGFRGRGMLIAVLDGGFMNVDSIPCMQKIDIVATKNIGVPKYGSVFNAQDHGTCVLSLMGVNEPNLYVGTAPEASFVLVKTEVGQYESAVEEDFWAMGAEFADSIGADVMNASLGYNLYDRGEMSHSYPELDGRTSLISRTASMLAQKGIVHCNSAGNSGNDPWKKIGVPADADNIIAVGALTPDSINADYSSVGPSADGRVKPDVVALGNPWLIMGDGTMGIRQGTSFAAPLTCGMIACLWQALPDKTAMEIMDIVRRSGNNYQHPDNVYGYGIPDFWKAYQENQKKEQ